MYEQQHPFKLNDLTLMSSFLNVFLSKAILSNLFGMFHIPVVINAYIFYITFTVFRSENNPRQCSIPIIAYSAYGVIQKRLQKKLYTTWSLDY